MSYDVVARDVVRKRIGELLKDENEGTGFGKCLAVYDHLRPPNPGESPIQCVTSEGWGHDHDGDSATKTDRYRFIIYNYVARVPDTGGISPEDVLDALQDGVNKFLKKYEMDAGYWDCLRLVPGFSKAVSADKPEQLVGGTAFFIEGFVVEAVPAVLMEE